MAIPNPLPIEDEAQDGQAIVGGALNITKGTFLATVISEFLLAFNGVFEKIFGENQSAWVKPAVMITLIAVWGLIATADVLARGYANAHTNAAAGAAGEVVPVPTDVFGKIKVKITKKGDDPIGRLIAVRATGAADSREVELLVAKDDGGLEWAPTAKVKKVT
jgi:hypothetical protein